MLPAIYFLAEEMDIIIRYFISVAELPFRNLFLCSISVSNLNFLSKFSFRLEKLKMRML